MCSLYDAVKECDGISSFFFIFTDSARSFCTRRSCNSCKKLFVIVFNASKQIFSWKRLLKMAETSDNWWTLSFDLRKIEYKYQKLSKKKNYLMLLESMFSNEMCKHNQLKHIPGTFNNQREQKFRNQKIMKSKSLKIYESGNDKIRGCKNTSSMKQI